MLSILSLNPRLPISVASDFIINHLKSLAEGIAAVEDKVVSVMNDLETISYTKNALNQVPRHHPLCNDIILSVMIILTAIMICSETTIDVDWK